MSGDTTQHQNSHLERRIASMKPSDNPRNSTFGEEQYDEFTMLERLETLREDMEDLGVTSLQELIERIKILHRKLDAAE